MHNFIVLSDDSCNHVRLVQMVLWLLHEPLLTWKVKKASIFLIRTTALSTWHPEVNQSWRQGLSQKSKQCSFQDTFPSWDQSWVSAKFTADSSLASPACQESSIYWQIRMGRRVLRWRVLRVRWWTRWKKCSSSAVASFCMCEGRATNGTAD